MKLEFRHRNCQREYVPATFAVYIPSKDALLDSLELGLRIFDGYIGVAYLHKDDQYEKKKGRQIAALRMMQTPWNFSRIEMREDQRILFIYRTAVPAPESHETSWYEVEMAVAFRPEDTESRLEYIDFIL